ncbi:MAG: LPXTG cell wall anchor domain-containing protein, partial [Anaerotignum sp.]|nr:LPXTG cell wall anchor domain-containing protein [Anaerotignum sp.]
GEQYGKTLKWLQIFYNLGGIIFTAIPGIIADHTGEYKSSYFLFAGMMTVSLFILLWTYRWKKRITPISS